MTLAPVALARLGISVTDPVTVNETALRSAEAQGMMRGQENVLHLVVGLNAKPDEGCNQPAPRQ